MKVNYLLYNIDFKYYLRSTEENIKTDDAMKAL